jgi:CYTH domain-containing protein
MPTENERKFLLKAECEPVVNEISSEQYLISQGYLIATRGITVRIRKSVKKSNNSENYYFTLKVNAGGRCIEVEKNIDQRDFNDLWTLALNQLEKIRYIIRHGKNTWELDFFKDYRNQTYMAVAEVELPEDQIEPDTVPDIVKKNLIFKVPLTDNRFSNKLLSNAKYAADLMKTIKSEKP